MSTYPVGRRPRSADLHSKLRLAALAAVVVGVVLLAAAAFVLSYAGIHQIALHAGLSQGLAKLYPLIFDVMLVIAAAAALALRDAGWWPRFYAWASLLLLLAAVAIGNAVHATGTTLPAQPTRAAVAVTPWVLLLMAFGLLLEMLRHYRTARATAAKTATVAVVSGADGARADANGGQQTAVTRADAPSGKVRSLQRVDLDTLLGPRAGQPPAVAVPATGAGEDASHEADPVSYGEETGYVHPDSHLDEGEYSPHGDAGGAVSHARQAGDNAGNGGHPAGNGPTAQAPATTADTPATTADTPATTADTPATTADTPATTADTPATTATPPATAAQPSVAAPETPAGETAAGAGDGPAAGGDRAAEEDRAAAKTPAGPAGASQASDGVPQEMAGAEGPALERMRSSPTRPE